MFKSKRNRADMLAPKVIYDFKTGEYVVLGRQPMFGNHGPAPEMLRTKSKAEAKAKLVEVLATDKKELW